MGFNIIKKSEKTFKKVNYFKARDLSILEFQMRILDLASSDKTPILEKMNFLKIIISNIEEFISIKFQELNDKEIDSMIFILESMYRDIANIIKSLNQLFGLVDTEDEMYVLVKNTDIEMVYTGEDDSYRESELMEELHINPTKKCDIALYYGKLDFLNIADYTIHVPREILLINKYIIFYKNQLVDTGNLRYPETPILYEKHDYYTELQNKDILFRAPYESYQMILDFIDQMCINENINFIFIALYRTANNSKIIESLIKARRLGKQVFVYVEPTARGNETQNIDIINKMRGAGICVQSTYFEYKIHSKLFCAIDKNYKKYVHVGTGNYNEDTAKLYTDTHLLSSNEIVTTKVSEVFMSIFSKNPKFNNLDDCIQTSPLNLRNTINDLINNEISKGDKGDIFIKCNNLCDLEIIESLYKAAKVGVKIRILCRTGCSMRTKDNIDIRSKVGKYLEHDRVYIFGDKTFISSADLLLRNISKRVETLCEITDIECKNKLNKLMDELFNSPLIHCMESDGKWELNHG